MDLILNVHLKPTGKEETVTPLIGVYFTDKPQTRFPMLIQLEHDRDLDIPAGAKNVVVTRSYKLPVPVDLVTVQPHAHYLARQIDGDATLPDGTTKRLISISDWDFTWQDVYRYTTPVSLPAGTTVRMRWRYDNSTDNPRNPSVPPMRVRYGQRTSEEMSELWFQVVPRNTAERDVLTRDLRSAVLREELNGYETMIAADAGNVALHDDIALMYEAAGNHEKAAAHFAESARLRPDSAAAQYNLATALATLKRTDEARRGFERAIALDPSYANGYRGVAMLLQAAGEFDEAAKNYRRAIEIAPGDAVAHHNYGVLLHTQGHLDDAMRQYQDAVRLNRDYADAHYGMALVLEAWGRTNDAISEYHEALRVRPEWPAAQRELDALLVNAARLSPRKP